MLSPSGSAATVVITVPLIVLVVIFQRRIIAGLTAGAVKGEQLEGAVRNEIAGGDL
jgi:hypothetical protein